MIDLTHGGKSPLTVNNPVLLASGVAGFDGGPYADLLDLSKLGAIVTNPLTWRPRRAAQGPRIVPLPAGALVHTGLPNPGVRRAVKLYRARWARSLAPIIAHVVATTPEDIASCVAELERCEAIAAVELGLHDQASAHDVERVLRSAQAATLLPLPCCARVTRSSSAMPGGRFTGHQATTPTPWCCSSHRSGCCCRPMPCGKTGSGWFSPS